MTSGLPTQKLLKTAFYTSIILIGTFAIAPHLIIFRSSTPSAFFMGVISVAVFLLLLWLINILLLYVTAKFIRQQSLTLKRWFASYLICFLSIWLSRRFIDSFVHDPGRAPAHLYAIFVLGFILNSVVLIIQDLIIIKDKKSKVELENAELNIKNFEATNLQLKQQIHPHFLFNSLSTLKTLIKKDTVQAENYLTKLSDFLRAALLSTTPNTISLSVEIKLCVDYLEMQKMRFGEALQFNINIAEEIRQSASVPIFSVLPLLENAIKHNKFTQEKPLYINIAYQNGWLVISNKLSPRETFEQSTGLGLANLSARYAVLSGDRVVIDNDGETFSVSIKTLPDENSNNRG
jgi:two-component system, LytTR family, sensor kinase